VATSGCHDVQQLTAPIAPPRPKLRRTPPPLQLVRQLTLAPSTASHAAHDDLRERFGGTPIGIITARCRRRTRPQTSAAARVLHGQPITAATRVVRGSCPTASDAR